MLGLFKPKTLALSTEEMQLAEIVEVKNLLLRNFTREQLCLSIEEYDFLATSSAHLSWFYQPLQDIWQQAHTEKRLGDETFDTLNLFISILTDYAITNSVNPETIAQLTNKLRYDI